jgi:hypothetical protein
MAKYPLEPLARLRDDKAGQAARALAGSVRAREGAARGVRAAEVRRDAHVAAVSAVHTGELEALAKGELCARDLARSDAWGVRVGAEKAALAGVVERARATETKARADEAAAQHLLTSRQADAKVVDGHRRHWEGEVARRLEAREEEASFEAWRPKR